MSWNHRVVKRKDEKTGEEWFAVHEAYYEDGTDKADSITKDGVAAQGESIEELREELTRMLQATKQPILNHEDF